jgi:GTP:adenosylcobinamide-phosphate guanylyltransferase
MLAHVLSALEAANSVGRVIVLAQDCGIIREALGARFNRVTFAESKSSIAETLFAYLSDKPAWPILVTTADHALLSPRIVDHFTSAARADVSFGVVSRSRYMRHFPCAARTWVRARGDAYSGANLFAFRNAGALAAIGFWASLEKERKKGWKLLVAVGPLLALGALSGVLSLADLARRLSARLGIGIAAVELPFAEAALDVDKPNDLVLVESIFEARERLA